MSYLKQFVSFICGMLVATGFLYAGVTAWLTLCINVEDSYFDRKPEAGDLILFLWIAYMFIGGIMGLLFSRVLFRLPKHDPQDHSRSIFIPFIELIFLVLLGFLCGCFAETIFTSCLNETCLRKSLLLAISCEGIYPILGYFIMRRKWRNFRRFLCTAISLSAVTFITAGLLVMFDDIKFARDDDPVSDRSYLIQNKQSWITHDEKVRLSAPSSFDGIPYFIETADGRKFSGRLGEDGLLPRIITNREKYTIYCCDEALVMIENNKEYGHGDLVTTIKQRGSISESELEK